MRVAHARREPFWGWKFMISVVRCIELSADMYFSLTTRHIFIWINSSHYGEKYCCNTKNGWASYVQQENDHYRGDTDQRATVYARDNYSNVRVRYVCTLTDNFHISHHRRVDKVHYVVHTGILHYVHPHTTSTSTNLRHLRVSYTQPVLLFWAKQCLIAQFACQRHCMHRTCWWGLACWNRGNRLLK